MKQESAEPPHWTASFILGPVSVEHRISAAISLLPASVQRNLPPIRSLSTHRILRWRHAVARSSDGSEIGTPPTATPVRRRADDAPAAALMEEKNLLPDGPALIPGGPEGLLDDTTDEEEDVEAGYFAASSASAESTRPTTPSASRPGTSAGWFTPCESGVVASSTTTLCDDPRSSKTSVQTQLTPLPRRHPSRTGSSGPGPEAVDQKLKAVGYSLLRLSDAEARRRAEPDYDALLERRVFLDGVAYLVRAMPGDLSEAEVRALRASLPTSIITAMPPGDDGLLPGDAHTHTNNQTTLVVRQPPPPPLSGLSPDKQTVLYRAVRFLVAQLLVAARLLLPALLLLAQAAARADKEYGVSAAVAGRGSEMVAALGRAAAARLEGGAGDEAGRALGGVVAWTVQGFAGGFTDGVGEGLGVVGARGLLSD